MPKFLVMIKANEETESGVPPNEEIIDAMTRYNEELGKAGALVDLAGLQPSSAGARVLFSKNGTRVVDGPFAETKELIAGYWLIDVASKDEAVEWAKRVPFEPSDEYGNEMVIEVRQLFELEDFPESDAIERARKIDDYLKR